MINPSLRVHQTNPTQSHRQRPSRSRTRARTRVLEPPPSPSRFKHLSKHPSPSTFTSLDREERGGPCFFHLAWCSAQWCQKLCEPRQTLLSTEPPRALLIGQAQIRHDRQLHLTEIRRHGMGWNGCILPLGIVEGCTECRMQIQSWRGRESKGKQRTASWVPSTRPDNPPLTNTSRHHRRGACLTRQKKAGRKRMG